MIIKLVGAINDLLWGDLIILEFSGGEVQFGLSLLVLILIPAGLYFTFKTKFLPFRLFPEMIRVTLEKDETKKDENSISGVQALIVATATRVGMGNLAGVVAAISFGGAGAVFWMWLTALIGSSSSFVESTLAQIYKEKDPLYGGYRGGPAYVMDRIRLVTKIKREDVFVKNVKEEAEYVADDEQTYYTRGCKYGLLGTAFALSGLLCWAGISQVIGNSVTTSFQNAFGIPQVATATILVAMSAVIVLRKNATVKVLDMVVPVMAGAYFLVTLFVIIKNITLLPSVIGNIFSQAFGIRQFAGGGLGVIVMNGVKRGLFSNEAGSGSAPCAAAAAEVSHPVKQGLIQALSVFTDTIVICSCTAFIILLSDLPLDGTLKGIQLTQAAVGHEIGPFGAQFIAFCILLFAFSSIVGNYSYCETNLFFISRHPAGLQIYRIAVGGMVFFGSVAGLDIVWNLADLFMALMTLINLIALIFLGHLALKALKNYNDQKRRGIKSPVFKASDIPEIEDQLSEWK